MNSGSHARTSHFTPGPVPDGKILDLLKLKAFFNDNPNLAGKVSPVLLNLILFGKNKSAVTATYCQHLMT